MVDGLVVPARLGETIAAALFAAGKRSTRTSVRLKSPRGLYCGLGVCFDCVMIVNGRSNVRTCQTPVTRGMKLETQEGCGRRGPCGVDK